MTTFQLNSKSCFYCGSSASHKNYVEISILDTKWIIADSFKQSIIIVIILLFVGFSHQIKR